MEQQQRVRCISRCGSGLVTAVSAGNATITATVGGKQATCEVTVADAVPEGLTVTTYEALLEALRTGGASADVPTLISGSDITIRQVVTAPIHP